jgi:HlyD family secretion protein
VKHIWERSATIFAVLILAGLLVYGFRPQPIQVDVATVGRGSVVVTVDDDGDTRIREKYLITAPVTGRLVRIQLKEGDFVEQNKTELMQILPADPSLLDARSRAESQARAQAADAALDESEALFHRAREAADLAQSQYERALKLYQEVSISQSEFEEAEHRHRMSQAELRSAEFRSKMKLYEKEQARAALMKISEFSDEGKSTPMKILSPIDGRVLRILHEDSSVISVGTAILEVGDPRDLEILIDVLSSDAVSIEPGARVFIEHWGGDRTLNGTVRTIEPSAFLKISALGVEEKRVNVVADFVEPWEERKTLGDGFRIEARIVAASSDPRSLKVASGTLFRFRDEWHVYRVEKERATLVPVKVGKSNGRQTEIFEGLNEGDIVILHPSDQVRQGTYVEPTRRDH